MSINPLCPKAKQYIIISFCDRQQTKIEVYSIPVQLVIKALVIDH